MLGSLGYSLSICPASQILLPVPERADAWVQPNAVPLLEGSPALKRMLGGQVNDLKTGAAYLEAMQGGGFSRPGSGWPKR